jgi:hypothetical protein
MNTRNHNISKVMGFNESSTWKFIFANGHIKKEDLKAIT